MERNGIFAVLVEEAARRLQSDQVLNRRSLLLHGKLGGQRDDDFDGFGNKCDAKFPGSLGSLVGSGDLARFRMLNGKMPGPKCATCPLECEGGALRSCEP